MPPQFTDLHLRGDVEARYEELPSAERSWFTDRCTRGMDLVNS
jgi:hypothetical protein